MSDRPHPAVPGAQVPSLRLIEWIPSTRDSGMLRVRGDAGDPGRSAAAAPVLALRAGESVRTLPAALGDASSEGTGWRAAFLVATAAVQDAHELWLEWPDGVRIALPEIDVTRGHVLGEPPPPPAPVEAEVFDRAVLAERRAQRAESAQRAQARAAAEAMAALAALERRVEELTRERDSLTTRVPPLVAETAPVRLVPAPGSGPASTDELSSRLDSARELQRQAEERAHNHAETLAEALGTVDRLKLQVSDLRLRLRTHMASASADGVRLAVLESERRGFRARLRDLRAELDALRARLLPEQQARARLAAELDRAAREREELAGSLAAERRTRTEAESEARAQRARADEAAALLTQVQGSLSQAREAAASERERLTSGREGLAQQLRTERAARASLAMDLRVSRYNAGAAGAQAAVNAALQARLKADGEAAEQRAAEREAELLRTREALEVARGRLRRAAAAVEEAAPVAAEPAISGDLQQRIAALQHTESGAALKELASTQATAPRTPAGEAAELAARFDAAAASLRATVPMEEAPARARERVDNGASLRAPDAPSPSTMALARRPSAVFDHRREPMASSIAARTRRLPSLRSALVRLAQEDPFAAARLLAGLLPAQGAFLDGDIDYDLTIRELGTFAVTVVAGRTSVRVLQRPRSRREAELHLSAHALTLAELLAGRTRRVGRVFAPVKVRGSRRRLGVLAALADARPNLAELARAGARLDPALLARALPYVIDGGDTEGHHFTVAQEIGERAPETWYVTVAGRRGVSVSRTPPPGRPDARVTMTRTTFDRLLREERPERAEKPWVRGDFAAVELLRGWIDAARS